ncbi:MAG: hydrogenase maturation protease [Bacteroidales bacterium]|nr:hydrogenase maturation protease [Bacteroidales bacterium]
MKEKILILGLGNDILSDDGIGPRLIKDIGALFPDLPARFATACCGGLEIIEMIKDHETVIFIDAIHTSSGIPGTVYHLSPSQFGETNHLSNIHDINFIEALRTCEMLGIRPAAEIHIIAVEITEDRVFCERLSDTLEERYPEILITVSGIIRNITAGK